MPLTVRDGGNTPIDVRLSRHNDASLALKSNKIDASVGKTHISTYQPAAAPVAPVNGGDKATLTMASSRVISGDVLLGVGVLLCLFGFRYLRCSLLLTGFIGGGIAAFAILTNTEPDGLWSNRILIYVAMCIAAGLLIGVLMLGLNKCAAWILGGAGGKKPSLVMNSKCNRRLMTAVVNASSFVHELYTLTSRSLYDAGLALGVYILSWRAGGLIHNTAGRIGLMTGSAALGMFLLAFFGKLTIIFATVLIGGYMFTLGLDMFLRTGFLENYKYLFRTGNNVPYQMYSGIYGMLGILSLTFLLGYLFQIPLYFLHKRKQRAHIPPAEPYGVSNRDSQYGGQWGSQYGSRDHLGAPQNQGAPAEYTWWGKRKTKETPMNNPYSHGYSEKGYQPVYSQNNLNQPIHGENNLSHPTHDTPVATSSSTHVQASQAALVGGTASTTTEKPVVFEEKNWLGRTKVVPKLAENSTSTTTTTTTAEPNH
ncbi:hypothetical protein BGX33_009183 [Mortierella sp. NVP41]|nr:hypothetical protein BGX33_009183 [Mortierella sp. NVP41]